MATRPFDPHLHMGKTRSTPERLPVIDVGDAPTPLASDIGSMLGLIQGGTAVPLEERGTPRAFLPFEAPHMRALIMDRLRKGYPVKVVLRAAGISAAQWRAWQAKGRRAVEPHATFLHEVEVAAAEGACSLMDHIVRAGEGAPDQHGIWKNQWQASRYLLEVGDPDTFKPVEKSMSAHIDLTPPQVVDVRKMSEADLLALTELAERAPTLTAGLDSADEDT